MVQNLKTGNNWKGKELKVRFLNVIIFEPNLNEIDNIKTYWQFQEIKIFKNYSEDVMTLFIFQK